MLFDKLLRKQNNPKNVDKAKKHIDSVSPEVITEGPVVNYQKRAVKETVKHQQEFDPVVLWWIAKKKTGYELEKQSAPKWFYEKYGISFDSIMQQYLDNGYLEKAGGIVRITQLGNDLLHDKSHIVFIHEHPIYNLTVNDFEKAKTFKKVQNTDIAWGVFNSRILEYGSNSMWKAMECTYANMADLLIGEKKYSKAIDFVFAASFLETSGMGDNNTLTPIRMEFCNGKYKRGILENGIPDIEFLEINNYHVTAPFLKIQKELNLSWQDVEKKYVGSALVNGLEDILPFKYFEKEESFLIFREAVEKGDKKGIFPLESVKQKLKFNEPDEDSTRYFYASLKNKTGINLY